jgi:aspartyl-tRNA(Asn)/glutamyl-tRNA(Gln) amidotransferase subunit C
MISLEEVKQLSRLCKIKFSDNEIGDVVNKLQNVIELIEQLEEVDTDGIEPLTSVVKMNLRMREDEVTIGHIEDELFSNVPGSSAALAHEIKCFVVPKVVE